MLAAAVIMSDTQKRVSTDFSLPSVDPSDLVDEAKSFVGQLLFGALKEKTSEAIDKHKNVVIGLAIGAVISLGGYLFCQIGSASKTNAKIKKLTAENEALAQRVAALEEAFKVQFPNIDAPN